MAEETFLLLQSVQLEIYFSKSQQPGKVSTKEFHHWLHCSYEKKISFLTNMVQSAKPSKNITVTYRCNQNMAKYSEKWKRNRYKHLTYRNHVHSVTLWNNGFDVIQLRWLSDTCISLSKENVLDQWIIRKYNLIFKKSTLKIRIRQQKFSMKHSSLSSIFISVDFLSKRS